MNSLDRVRPVFGQKGAWLSVTVTVCLEKALMLRLSVVEHSDLLLLRSSKPHVAPELKPPSGSRPADPAAPPDQMWAVDSESQHVTHLANSTSLHKPPDTFHGGRTSRLTAWIPLAGAPSHNAVVESVRGDSSPSQFTAAAEIPAKAQDLILGCGLTAEPSRRPAFTNQTSPFVTRPPGGSSRTNSPTHPAAGPADRWSTCVPTCSHQGLMVFVQHRAHTTHTPSQHPLHSLKPTEALKC